MIESVGSSTRIEGSRMNDREVAELLGQIGIRSFQTRNEQEVAGYAFETTSTWVEGLGSLISFGIFDIGSGFNEV